MILSLDKKLCFIEKPKCGSTSVRAAFERFSRKANFFHKAEFIGKDHDIRTVDYNYKNPEYRHCDFNTCLNYISSIGFEPGEFEFLSLLREPLELVSSTYFYETRKNEKLNKMFLFDTVEEMFETKHYKFFTDKNYFLGHEEYNVKFFDVENIQGAFEYINAKYNLRLRNNHRNKQNEYKVLDLSESALKRIYQDHYLYQTAANVNRFADTVSPHCKQGSGKWIKKLDSTATNVVKIAKAIFSGRS